MGDSTACWCAGGSLQAAETTPPLPRKASVSTTAPRTTACPILMLCSPEFIGSHDPAGWKLAERVTPITYIASTLWLITTGVVLLA